MKGQQLKVENKALCEAIKASDRISGLWRSALLWGAVVVAGYQVWRQMRL